MESDAGRLGPIFQKGVHVPVRTGHSIKHLLREQWGIDEGYVMNRISTLFLDSKPVDDIEKAIVRDGSVLSLSSAMPGLMGATMRRGGFFAGFRGDISHVSESEPDDYGDGIITLKLFNLLIRELGPRFLERGFWAERVDLATHLPALRAETSEDPGTEASGLVWVTFGQETRA